MSKPQLRLLGGIHYCAVNNNLILQRNGGLRICINLQLGLATTERRYLACTCVERSSQADRLVLKGRRGKQIEERYKLTLQGVTPTGALY